LVSRGGNWMVSTASMPRPEAGLSGEPRRHGTWRGCEEEEDIRRGRELRERHGKGIRRG
jgi:hypothetical protein